MSVVHRRKLKDGTILARIKVPVGPGYDYYIDQGKTDGLIYIGTTSFPRARLTYISMMQWDLEADIPPAPDDPQLQPKFNRDGWRY